MNRPTRGHRRAAANHESGVGFEADGSSSSRARARMRLLVERLGLAAFSGGDGSYDAFLSYSHAADGATVTALQRALHAFAKPWYRARALRIFRDNSSLSADPSLWRAVAAALDRSRFLILLASPDAGASPWVAREVAHWCDRPERRGNVCLVLTAGRLVWDAASGDFDWTRTDALPPTAKGVFSDEPRFVDLRWVHGDAQAELSLRNPVFRDAVADLAAPLRGVPKDDLESDDLRQHRRTVRIARAVASVLVVLTAAALVFGVFALRQRDRALAAHRRDVSQLLAGIAANRMESRLDVGLLLSVAAYRTARSPEAIDSVLAGAARTANVVGFLGTAHATINDLAFDGEGDRLATAGEDGVTLWTPGTTHELAHFAVGRSISRVALSGDGRFAATLDQRRHLVVWTGASWRAFAPVGSTAVTSLAFAPSSRVLAIGTADGRVMTWSPGSARHAALRIGRHEIFALAFDAGGTHLAAGGPDGITLLTCTDGRCVRRGPPRAIGAVVQDVAFMPGGNRLVVLGNDGAAMEWDVAAGRQRKSLAARGVERVAVARTGEVALGFRNGAVTVGKDGSPIARLAANRSQITRLSFAPRGDRLVSATANGGVVIWSYRHSPVVRVDRTDARPLTSVGYVSPTAVVLSDSTRVLVRDSAGHERLLTGAPAQIVSVASAPSARRVVAAGTTLTTWAAPLWVPRTSHATRARDVLSVAVSFDGDVVATGDTRGRVTLWRSTPAGFALWRSLPSGGHAAIVKLAFAAGSSKLLAAGAGDGRVALWDLDGAGPPTIVRAALAEDLISALAVSPSGDAVAYSGVNETQAFIWSRQSGQRRAVAPRNARITALAFAPPDGAIVAVADADGNTELWDRPDARPLGRVLRSGAAAIVGVSFDAAGRALVVGSKDGAVAVWSDALWNPELARKRVCSVVGRPLSRDEWRTEFPSGSQTPSC